MKQILTILAILISFNITAQEEKKKGKFFKSIMMNYLNMVHYM